MSTLSVFDRHGTCQHKSQADDYDRHTASRHTAISAEFNPARRLCPSAKHIQPPFDCSHPRPPLVIAFRFVIFRQWAKYISEHSSDQDFQFAVFGHGRNTLQNHSSDHGSNPFFNPSIGEYNFSVFFLSRHGVRATRNSKDCRGQ